MKILLIGASLVVLAVTTAAAQQPAPQPPPHPAMTGAERLGAPPETGIHGGPPPAPAIGPIDPIAPPPARPPRPGAQLTLGGFYGFGIDDSDHLVGLALAYRRGLAQRLGLSLQQAGFWNFGDGIGGRSAAGLTIELDDAPGLLPYIGGNFGAIYGNGIDNALFAGPEVGLRLGPLNAKLAYDMPFNKSVGRGNVVVTLGLGVDF